MTRHARNATAGSVYTYHEKKKDTQASGYGSQLARLGKDSVKDFDCCSLTLQPCREPVVTPDGHLYDKEAIFEYILHQKQQYAKQMKAYQKQKKELEAEEKEKSLAGSKATISKFLSTESSIMTKRDQVFKNAEASTSTGGNSVAGPSSLAKHSSVSNMSEEKKKNLPSFWIPSLTPEAKQDLIKKPDGKTYCPMSGKPLKIKDLTPVKFTLVPDDDKKALVVKQARYMCPVTHDVLGNSVPCAVLRKTGDVVTMDCVERLIKKDWICPLTGQTLVVRDIIPLQRGGTGFAAAGQNLEAVTYRPSMQT